MITTEDGYLCLFVCIMWKFLSINFEGIITVGSNYNFTIFSSDWICYFMKVRHTLYRRWCQVNLIISQVSLEASIFSVWGKAMGAAHLISVSLKRTFTNSTMTKWMLNNYILSICIKKGALFQKKEYCKNKFALFLLGVSEFSVDSFDVTNGGFVLLEGGIKLRREVSNCS